MSKLQFAPRLDLRKVVLNSDNQGKDGGYCECDNGSNSNFFDMIKACLSINAYIHFKRKNNGNGVCIKGSFLHRRSTWGIGKLGWKWIAFYKKWHNSNFHQVKGIIKYICLVKKDTTFLVEIMTGILNSYTKNAFTIHITSTRFKGEFFQHLTCLHLNHVLKGLRKGGFLMLSVDCESAASTTNTTV